MKQPAGIKPNHDTPMTAIASTSDSEPARRRSVLIVDSDPNARESYARSLDRAGYQVFQASTGVDALSQTSEALPDIVVTGMTLPDMQGVEFLSAVRTTPRTAHIPIILLTGWIDERTQARAMLAGATTVLLKPCMPDALVSEISHVLTTDRFTFGTTNPRDLSVLEPR
jgi:DNA-binding response OmpR family regulator